MRHALSALLVISRSVEAAAPYRIDVKPGHATVPRGADQAISAHLLGFQADQASLMIRKSPTAAFERLPLIRGESDTYDGTLFDVTAPLDYFVEAVGVRSPVYSLKVADMPYVQRLELEYHFPAYTGLEPRKIEDGGDITVLRGTEVHVRAVPTMAAHGGQLLIDDKTTVPMSVQADGALTAKFTADHDGFYKIELDAPNGPRVAHRRSTRSTCLPISRRQSRSRSPGATPRRRRSRRCSSKPRRKTTMASSHWSSSTPSTAVPRRSCRCSMGPSAWPTCRPATRCISKSSNVQPGDSVSYFARALDNGTVPAPQRGTSDMYFIRVRPLQKDFRKADSQAGGGGGGQQNQVGALSEQERQIISATFNLQRDRKTMTPDRLRESSVVVALMQKRLREQVAELVQNFATRVSAQADRFKKITDFLKQSVPEMQGAEGKLQGSNPEAALTPEQRALEFLQKAEEEYELQVSANRQAGGEGGGGDNKMAEELADLFELEVDRMANQYRDVAAREPAAGRSEDRRACREAEGARAASGTGG